MVAVAFRNIVVSSANKVEMHLRSHVLSVPRLVRSVTIGAANASGRVREALGEVVTDG